MPPVDIETTEYIKVNTMLVKIIVARRQGHFLILRAGTKPDALAQLDVSIFYILH